MRTSPLALVLGCFLAAVGEEECTLTTDGDGERDDVVLLGDTPYNVIPGVMSELNRGFDITAGDSWKALRMQVFDWSWEQKMQLSWNRETFAVPDLLSIAIRNECLISELQMSSATYSFSETMHNEASSHNAGFDTGKIDIGVKVKGFGIGAEIQNSMMFGSGKVAMDYKAQAKERRTMSMLTKSTAWAYSSQLADFAITDSDFHPYFKAQVKKYAADPSTENAHKLLDNYGTHFIKKAELGGSAVRNMFFSENTDSKAAEEYGKKQKSSGSDWLFFHDKKSSSEVNDFKSSSGETASVFSTGTYIVGGDPAAGTPGEFCSSVQNKQNPRVMQSEQLVPIWDYFHVIDGVGPKVGENLRNFVATFWEEGEHCALNTCGGQISMCSWNPKSRSWSAPCNCIGGDARTIQRSGDGVTMIELTRTDGVKASFSGWTINQGNNAGYQVFRVDTSSDCFFWDDGKASKQKGYGCASGSTLDVFPVGPNHGDVCRSTSGGLWTCPIGCVMVKGRAAPYCVWEADTRITCHESTKPIKALQALGACVPETKDVHTMPMTGTANANKACPNYCRNELGEGWTFTGSWWQEYHGSVCECKGCTEKKEEVIPEKGEIEKISVSIDPRFASGKISVLINGSHEDIAPNTATWAKAVSTDFAVIEVRVEYDEASADCEGIPHGHAKEDACGVCGGDGSSCKDCAGVPHGPSKEDACGVCGGDGSSCTDCAGVPHGPSKKDACGVCGGNGSSCKDCAGIPHGPAKKDACGVCGGDGSSCGSGPCAIYGGIEGGNGACCAASCGACGGSDCSKRPGGAEKCCGGHFKRIPCTDSRGAPCTILDLSTEKSEL